MAYAIVCDAATENSLNCPSMTPTRKCRAVTEDMNVLEYVISNCMMNFISTCIADFAANCISDLAFHMLLHVAI